MDVARYTKLFWPAAVLQSGVASLSLLRVFRESLIVKWIGHINIQVHTHSCIWTPLCHLCTVSLRTGCMWSYFPVEVIIRAAKFCADCNFKAFFLEIPPQTEVEKSTENQCADNSHQCLFIQKKKSLTGLSLLLGITRYKMNTFFNQVTSLEIRTRFLLSPIKNNRPRPEWKRRPILFVQYSAWRHWSMREVPVFSLL